MVTPKEIYEQYNSLNKYVKQLEIRLNMVVEKSQHLKLDIEMHKREFNKLKNFTYALGISLLIPIIVLLYRL